jgi:transcriptional regulator GlxA family with amidase domain
MLGDSVIAHAMRNLIDNRDQEAHGLAFDPHPAKDDPLGALGFDFRLYKQGDSVGRFTARMGVEDYSVARLYLDITPIRMAPPVPGLVTLNAAMYTPAPPPRTIGLFLCPGFGLAGLGDALSVFAAANDVLGSVVYRSLALSHDALPVTSAEGLTVHAQDALHRGLALDGLLVISIRTAGRHETARHTLELLRHFASEGCMMGGIGCGAALLAQAGLLRGYRATQQDTHLGDLADEFADTVVSGNLFEIDRQRLSCGAHAVTNMLLTWLGSQHGQRMALEVAALLGRDTIRVSTDRQQLPVAIRAGAGSAKLEEALALMEANLAEPLPTEEVARLVDVSRRQLERLFKQHLDELPSRYYLGLRLKRARRLLQQSSQSILQIGLACGFASGAHFSTAYRALFGRSPRDERSERAQAWRAEQHHEDRS